MRRRFSGRRRAASSLAYIRSLPPIDDRDQILHLRRPFLRQRDPVERPLRPLDVDDELPESMASEAAIEILPVEERESGEQPLLRGERPLAIPGSPLATEPGADEADERKA